MSSGLMCRRARVTAETQGPQPAFAMLHSNWRRIVFAFLLHASSYLTTHLPHICNSNQIGLGMRILLPNCPTISS